MICVFVKVVYSYKKSKFELRVVFWLIWDYGNMLKFWVLSGILVYIPCDSLTHGTQFNSMKS